MTLWEIRLTSACVVLHNMCIRNKVQLILEDNEEHMPDNADLFELINVIVLNEVQVGQKIFNLVSCWCKVIEATD